MTAPLDPGMEPEKRTNPFISNSPQAKPILPAPEAGSSGDLSSLKIPVMPSPSGGQEWRHEGSRATVRCYNTTLGSCPVEMLRASPDDEHRASNADPHVHNVFVPGTLTTDSVLKADLPWAAHLAGDDVWVVRNPSSMAIRDYLHCMLGDIHPRLGQFAAREAVNNTKELIKTVLNADAEAVIRFCPHSQGNIIVMNATWLLRNEVGDHLFRSKYAPRIEWTGFGPGTVQVPEELAPQVALYAHQGDSVPNFWAKLASFVVRPALLGNEEVPLTTLPWRPENRPHDLSTYVKDYPMFLAYGVTSRQPLPDGAGKAAQLANLIRLGRVTDGNARAALDAVFEEKTKDPGFTRSFAQRFCLEAEAGESGRIGAFELDFRRLSELCRRAGLPPPAEKETALPAVPKCAACRIPLNLNEVRYVRVAGQEELSP